MTPTAVRRREARLEAKAAGLAIAPAPTPGTYAVASASDPAAYHTVNTNADPWTCDCMAGCKPSVWCAHKRRVRQELGGGVPMDQPDEERPSAATTAARTITWTGAITDRATAIQASGAIEGGARITLDIPDRSAHVIGQLVAARHKALRITVEIL